VDHQKTCKLSYALISLLPPQRETYILPAINRTLNFESELENSNLFQLKIVVDPKVPDFPWSLLFQKQGKNKKKKIKKHLKNSNIDSAYRSSPPWKVDMTCARSQKCNHFLYP
jgi:hypothetical protein